MAARIKALHQNIITTRNWYSLFGVYAGLTDHAVARLRNGTMVDVTKATLDDYRRIRTLAYRGVDVSRKADGKLWRLRFPNGLILLARPLSDDFISLEEVYFLEVYATDYDLNGQTVIDIGAGIADSSIFFASKGARVFAFEPLAESYLIGLENIKANVFEQRIHLVNKAVTDTEGERNLMVSAGNYRRTSIIKLDESLTSGKNGYSIQPIRTTTLASILRENALDVVDLLKIDAEGSEFDILNSTSEVALGKIRKMVVEFHRSPEQLVAFLNSLGFSVETRYVGEIGYLWARRSSIEMASASSD